MPHGHNLGFEKIVVRLLPSTLAIAAALALTPAGQAAAQAASETDVQKTVASPAEGAPNYAVSAEPVTDGWEVSLTPYVWFSGLEGDLGVSSSLPVAQADLSFGDIFDALKFGAMTIAEARRGRFVALGDLSFVDLEASKNVGVRDPSLVSAKLGSEMLMVTAEAGYRVLDGDASKVDFLGGVRVIDMDSSLDLSGPTRRLSGRAKESWVDPIIGFRAVNRLSDRWSLTLYGDIGGFGVGSDLTWQLLGAANYRFGSHWTAAVGWRHLDIDYAKGGFIFDAAMDGPIIGASYRF